MVNLEMSSTLTLVLSEGPFSFRGQPVAREMQGIFFSEIVKQEDNEIGH